MAMRCLWPPENSFGHRSRAATGSLTFRISSRASASASVSAVPKFRALFRMEWPTVCRGFEDRFLEQAMRWLDSLMRRASTLVNAGDPSAGRERMLASLLVMA